MQLNPQSYAQLLVDDTPMIDVRAPIEFRRGAFPTAINLPLLDDLQREIVGTCYKQQGQDKAIEKGHELVNGEKKEARVAAWTDFAERYPDAPLYCFRGGLRSKISQQWLQEAGIEIPRIAGGYKALRTFLINTLENAASECSYQLVGGRTGSAKTTLINQLHNGVDLEGAAYHRGSSFGAHARAQNSQIDFENRLAIDILKLQRGGSSNIVLEDESRTIGKIGLPKSLFVKMRSSPMVVIEAPFDVRLERLIQEYVVDMLSEFNTHYEENAFSAFSNYLLGGLKGIKRRLGSELLNATQNSMQLALKEHQNTGDITGHYDWLKVLLEKYYDPSYDYALNKRKEHISFRGDFQSCKDYLSATF